MRCSYAAYRVLGRHCFFSNPDTADWQLVAATCPATNESNATLPSLVDAQSGSLNDACQ